MRFDCVIWRDGGDVGKALLADNFEAAKRQAAFWAALFPNRFYLELQRVGKPDEERYIAAALDLAVALDLPVVATNDVRFLHSKDFQAMKCGCALINRGVRRYRVLKIIPTSNIYAQPKKWQSYLPIFRSLSNTVVIAQRCNLTLTLVKTFA